MLPGPSARRLLERYHPELSHVPVRHYTSSLLAHEVLWRAGSRAGWDLFTARNQWFQRRAATAIDSVSTPAGTRAMVFAHSYAALEIFKRAKPRGFGLVLGQIDPGAEHFAVVARTATNAPEYGPPPPAPPSQYLDDWREECRLADRIVVNSEWSRSCLERAGIEPAKLVVVPLAYEVHAGDKAATTERRYPEAFSAARPLRLLFVGHVAVAKGIKALLESLALLKDVPFELSIVGDGGMQVPRAHREHPRVRWVGPVSRSEVMRRYRDADLLIVPSLSDGFGMAQVEARGWRLPIVASRFCGQVVHDGVNGILLNEVTAPAIAQAVRRLADQPSLLASFSRNAATGQPASLASLGAALVQLEAS